jgi:hypothetical protein
MAVVRGRNEFAKRFHDLADDDFPGGPEKLDRATLVGRPSDGVFILKTLPDGERRGFRTGDIVVGFDGWRVRSRRQLFLVRLFDDRPEVPVVVFRHPGYVDISLRTVCRCLGVDLRSHKTAPAS